MPVSTMATTMPRPTDVAHAAGAPTRASPHCWACIGSPAAATGGDVPIRPAPANTAATAADAMRRRRATYQLSHAPAPIGPRGRLLRRQRASVDIEAVARADGAAGPRWRTPDSRVVQEQGGAGTRHGVGPRREEAEPSHVALTVVTHLCEPLAEDEPDTVVP